MDIIIDSRYDITLITEKTLGGLSESPKIKKGQKINLVQVTGKASISGYVELDLYFGTKEGPVKIKVEAYVVKGMTLLINIPCQLNEWKEEHFWNLEIRDNWLDWPNKHSEDVLRQAEAHAKLIKRLADIRTPNPSPGFIVPTNTTTSQAPEALKPHPVYYSQPRGHG